MWQKLGHDESLAYEQWPGYDEELTKEEELTVVFQVNGKVRAKLQFPADTSEDKLKEAALVHERIQEFTDGRQIVKVITVPGKLVNIVVK